MTPEQFKLLKDEMTLLDMGLSLALCHFDFASTREAVLKVQRAHVANLKALIAAHDPDKS